MKTTVIISRILLGFIYLVFGLDYFLHFIPYQPLHTGNAGAFIAGLKGTGYFYPMLKTIQIVGGTSLLVNRYAPFSAVVLFPVSLNVLLFHTFLVPSGWLMGVVLIVPNLLLGFGYWRYYGGIFVAKPVLIVFLLFAAYPAKSQSLMGKKDKLLDSMTSVVTGNLYSDINSILISKDGASNYEQYFNGWNKDSLHDSRSSFKSITSLLTGIAIDKGLIGDVNQKVYSFFPEIKDFSGSNAWKQDMTIENLLRMESGFDCEEFNEGKDCETEMTATKDWVRFSLDLPMKNKPGTLWAYTSCDPMIISGIISRLADMSIMEFAKKYLFDPMGISHYRWAVDPSGHGMTAGSFYIPPSDMMKIGEMVREKGMWNGRRIVSAAWLEKSTNAPVPIPDFSFVKFSRSAVAIPQPTYYGYYWYREEIRTAAFRENVLFASGNGGQYIMIIERLGIVVVFTQGNYNSWKAKRAFDLLARFILPAFEK